MRLPQDHHRQHQFLHKKQVFGVNAYMIMPTRLHAIVFDVQLSSEQLKHTLDDMRKFTGRQLLRRFQEKIQRKRDPPALSYGMEWNRDPGYVKRH